MSERERVRRLIDPESAADATAAFYALEHSREKVELYGYFPRDDRPSGFLALAQTGMDLFRRLAVPLVSHPAGLNQLLNAALANGRPVLLQLTTEQAGWLQDPIGFEEEDRSLLFRLDSRAYEPVVNVLVVEAVAPDSQPRYEIRSGEKVYAAAGINWQGQRFAEVYLQELAGARQREFTRSVLSAIVGRLLGEKRIALYRVPHDNLSRRTEAERLGFRRIGPPLVLGEARRTEPAQEQFKR